MYLSIITSHYNSHNDSVTTFSEYSNPVIDSLKSNLVILSGKHATCNNINNINNIMVS